MPFSPDYIRTVLRAHFEDGKALLLEPLMAIHHAHLVMLAETRIVSTGDARRIRQALAAIDFDAIRGVEYDGSCEDLYFFVDRLIAAGCGPDVAGRLHTARSRNDIDMTMYRMRLRASLLGLAGAALGLRRSLIGVAARHRETVFPAHTHTQPAQPTTIAHYLLGVIEALERDAARLSAAYARTNRCPLGACAITGTGWPINRDRTSALLGFDGPTGNTYGSIASVDYLLEAAGAVGVMLVGVGRFVQDLLLWCTSEVGYLRLPEGFVQVSSIMPQKRNPVALEHARALLSKAFGQANAIPIAVHNTPFGDIVDTEDDLQPLVAAMFQDATRALTLVGAAMAEAEFEVAKMRARATEGGVTLTELADALARDHGLSFAAGHAIAATVARAERESPGAAVGDLVRTASKDIAGREIRLSDDALAQILSPEHFVAMRRTHGGPAPAVTAVALDAARAQLADDDTTVAARQHALAGAEAGLKQAVQGI